MTWPFLWASMKSSPTNALSAAPEPYLKGESQMEPQILKNQLVFQQCCPYHHYINSVDFHEASLTLEKSFLDLQSNNMEFEEYH